MKNGIKTLFICSIVFITSCSEKNDPISVEVKKSEYNQSWPFPSYATGILTCAIHDFDGIKRPIITIQLGQTMYGLNGAAMGIGKYPDARTQMAKHPQYGTYELGATHTLIELAQKNCGWKD